MGISLIPKDRSDIQVFRTKLNMPVGVTVFLFLVAVLVYSRGIYKNIPVILVIFITFAVFVLLANHHQVCIAPEGVYIQKYIGLFTRKSVFFPTEQIKTVSVILSLKTHFVVMVTPDGSEKIPADSLTDTEGFMDLIQKKFSHVFKEHLDASKYA